MVEKNTDILCIVPPFSYGNYADIGPKCPNLGIASIAGYLEENNIKVKIVDAFVLELTFDQIKEEIKKHNPHAVLIGSVTATHSASLKIMEIAKEVDADMQIVIGGPHVTNAPESAFPQANYVVIGEGEETALELGNYILGKTNVKKEDIQGIAYQEDGKIKRTEKRPFITYGCLQSVWVVRCRKEIHNNGYIQRLSIQMLILCKFKKF